AARPDGALVLGAGRQRRLVKPLDRRPARRLEADRAAIGGAGRLAVGRRQHHELLGRLAPGRAAVAHVLEALVAERRQDRVIELPCLRQIVGPDRDMREDWHDRLPYFAVTRVILFPLTGLVPA